MGAAAPSETSTGGGVVISAALKSYVRPSMLTRDVEQARRYAADPLVERQIAVSVLTGMHDAAGVT